MKNNPITVIYSSDSILGSLLVRDAPQDVKARTIIGHWSTIKDKVSQIPNLRLFVVENSGYGHDQAEVVAERFPTAVIIIYDIESDRWSTYGDGYAHPCVNHQNEDLRRLIAWDKLSTATIDEMKSNFPGILWKE